MKLPEWATVQRAPSTFTFPGGESFSAMQHRIVSAIDKLRAAHPGGTIVCVSHADPIKAAVAHALGTHLDLFQRIVISTCAISVLAFSSGGPAVLAVNSTGGSLKELHRHDACIPRARERSELEPARDRRVMTRRSTSSTRSTRSRRRPSASPGRGSSTCTPEPASDA